MDKTFWKEILCKVKWQIHCFNVCLWKIIILLIRVISMGVGANSGNYFASLISWHTGRWTIYEDAVLVVNKCLSTRAIPQLFTSLTLVSIFPKKGGKEDRKYSLGWTTGSQKIIFSPGKAWESSSVAEKYSKTHILFCFLSLRNVNL